jgi:hypothetical protein
MKSPLRRLRGFGHHHPRERKAHRPPPAKLDELADAAQVSPSCVIYHSLFLAKLASKSDLERCCLRSCDFWGALFQVEWVVLACYHQTILILWVCDSGNQSTMFSIPWEVIRVWDMDFSWEIVDYFPWIMWTPSCFLGATWVEYNVNWGKSLPSMVRTNFLGQIFLFWCK